MAGAKTTFIVTELMRQRDERTTRQCRQSQESVPEPPGTKNPTPLLARAVSRVGRLSWR